MQLTESQKQELYTNGFVQLPDAVPRDLVNHALQAINHSLGEGVAPADLPVLRSQSYCPELRGTRVISDLFNASPLHSMTESLVGAGNILPVEGGQIALRFPKPPGTEPPAKQNPHLDGIYTPTNGVQKGTISNFTALIGVFLSDLRDENSGNFTVWPGTHRLFEEYFCKNDPQSLLDGLPRIDLPAPRQITAWAGDAVLCHYQLAHGLAFNVSPHIRYAVFFRIKHREHDANSLAVMTDIWMHWPGLHTMKMRNEAFVSSTR